MEKFVLLVHVVAKTALTLFRMKLYHRKGEDINTNRTIIHTESVHVEGINVQVNIANAKETASIVDHNVNV